MSKIAHYLEAFFIPCECIFPMCCTEDEGAVKGETGSERGEEKRGRDTKIKFTSFLLSAPCRQLMAPEPGTLCKLELTSHRDVKEGSRDHICLPLRVYYHQQQNQSAITTGC